METEITSRSSGRNKQSEIGNNYFILSMLSVRVIDGMCKAQRLVSEKTWEFLSLYFISRREPYPMLYTGTWHLEANN